MSINNVVKMPYVHEFYSNSSDKSQLPRVSVIIPVYNRESFIAPAIESVLAQTFKNFEIIIVDDGSSDRSIDIIQQYALRYPNIVFFVRHPNHQHRGVSASRNLGIRQARGEFIAFLDSDDLWLPEKLQQQVAILESDTTIGAACCALAIFDEYGVETEKLYGTHILNADYSGKNEHIFDTAFSRKISFGAGSTLMVRSPIVFEIGLFETSMNIGEDEVFASKIAFLYPIYQDSRPFVKYRIHLNNACWNVDSLHKIQKTNYYIMYHIVKWIKSISDPADLTGQSLRLLHLIAQSFYGNALSPWGLSKLLGRFCFIYGMPYKTVKTWLFLLFVRSANQMGLYQLKNQENVKNK